MPRGVNLNRVFLQELDKRGVSVKHIERLTYRIGGLKCYVKYANLAYNKTYWFGFPEKDIIGKVSEDTYAVLLCGKDTISFTFLMQFSILADFLKREASYGRGNYHCKILPDQNYQMQAGGKYIEMKKYAVSIDDFKDRQAAINLGDSRDVVKKPPEKTKARKRRASSKYMGTISGGEPMRLNEILANLNEIEGRKGDSYREGGKSWRAGLYHLKLRVARPNTTEFNTLTFDTLSAKLTERYGVPIKIFEKDALPEPPKKRQDESQKPTEEQPPAELDHDEIILHLLELGEINGFKVGTEYSCDAYRLDAVWLAEYSEVPKYCFEVHISGSLHKDIAALKHAYDKWNSKIFLICTGEDSKVCKRLISGSFHEIANIIQILDAKEFLEYCQFKFKEKFKKINGLFG